MNTEDNHPLRFDDIPEVLGWIKRKLVELDAKIDVIQGKKLRWKKIDGSLFKRLATIFQSTQRYKPYIRGQVQSASHTTKMASDYAF